MDYKVQFKSYDAVANTTKVAIKQDFPYRVFEEILPTNRTTEDDATLVEAVLNIVRMELDTSGAVVKNSTSLSKPIKMLSLRFKLSPRTTKKKQTKSRRSKKSQNGTCWPV